MAHAFNDDKTKAEVYTKDEVYSKSEVHAKDDFVVVDIQYPSMQHNEYAQKVVDITSYLPTSAQYNTDNYAVISTAVYDGGHEWSYQSAYKTDEIIPEQAIYPKVSLVPGSGNKVYLYTSLINLNNNGFAPILRVVLMRIQ